MGMLPKDLPKEEKLKYVLQLIAQGYDRKYISEDMGYSRPDSLDRFMNNHSYIKDKQTNSYVLPMEDTCPVNEIAITTEDTCPIDVAQEDTCPTINLQNQQKLLDIIDNHNKIMDIIKWFDTKEDSCPTEVIEVVNGLQINYNKSETVKTTVRVDKDIWNEFSNLCIDKYSQFSKIDILSQILADFIKTYK
ncbi:MAG: hypothetical protein J6D47_03605 [Peptostreptococcaceae bacterium]|nr:hypothetical protein [Peptostreptococcaceae bacterium]